MLPPKHQDVIQKKKLIKSRYYEFLMQLTCQLNSWDQFQIFQFNCQPGVKHGIDYYLVFRQLDKLDIHNGMSIK